MNRILHLMAGLLLVAGTVQHAFCDVVLISQSPLGTAPALKGASREAMLSSTGRFVVFSSLASLLPDDLNGVSDVYRLDRETNTLRLISDDRGGDQPRVSATGRFISFRSLDAFPKIRYVDTESSEPPRTISYPFGGGRSFRYSDSAALTADGRFVAFAFRPIPFFSGLSDVQLCVNDTIDPDRFNSGSQAASQSITVDFNLKTLGKTAMSNNGNTFFMETAEPLAGADTNTVRDIYLVNRGSNAFLRVSAGSAGLEGEEVKNLEARDPVLNFSGDTVYFISERQLRPADTDGRATIYRADVANLANTLAMMPTSVRPIALSSQAVGNGFLVFLGAPKTGAVRPYLLQLSNGTLTQLASAGEIEGGAPSISADGSTIAFSTRSALLRGDKNGLADIYTVSNPVQGSQAPAPVVALTGVTNDSLINAGTLVSLNASASGAGAILRTVIELNGAELTSSAGAATQFTNLSLPVGVNRLRALAFTTVGVTGISPEFIVNVRTSNQLRITGIRTLARKELADGSVDFAGSLRIDNGTNANAANLQVLLVAAPTPATWEIFGDEEDVPTREEGLLTLLELPGLLANTSTPVAFSGIAFPPEVVGDGQQGVAYTVIAQLRELVGNVFQDRGSLKLFEVRPRLLEETPGPNGGIPVLGAPVGGQFNPSVLQAINIVGPTSVPARTSNTLRANATFNNGTRPCNPVWRITSGSAAAVISSTGVLSTRNVASTQTVVVEATLGGRLDTHTITVRPVTPKISIMASKRAAVEGGTPGQFKILCSPSPTTDLTIDLEISGTAVNGVDYGTLATTVTIPARTSSVPLAVTAGNDGQFEGRESVMIRLLPPTAGNVRLGSVTLARTTIEDIQEVPETQPDVTIALSGRSAIGAKVFNRDSAVQQVTTRAAKDRTVTFNVRVAASSDVPQDFTLFGTGDFLGFTARYTLRGVDVTQAILDEQLVLTGVTAKRPAQLVIKIRPTADTPVGSVFRCPIGARHGGSFLQDIAEAAVQRHR